MRRLHRWLGLLLLVPLLLWITTGLLFHLKPGWSGAYEMLDSTPSPTELEPATIVSLERAVAGAGADPGALASAELVLSDLGALWRLGFAGGRHVLVDARTGALRSPLDEEACRALAAGAASRARATDRYGAVTTVEGGQELTDVRFAGGAVVTVDRATGRLSQRGADTDRIDLFYRLHYVQWTGHRTFDRFLAVLVLAALLGLAALGTVLLIRRRWV